MAILGTFIDKTVAVSLASSQSGQTYAHSLGAQPDSIWVEIRSIGAAGGFLWATANASLTTVGYVSAAAAPATVQFDLYSRVFHSIIK